MPLKTVVLQLEPGALKRVRQRVDTRRRYNYTIDREAGFIYYRAGKVATRTMTDWLESIPGISPEYLSNRHRPYDPFHRLFSFGLTRNPWDRLVSCWLEKVRKGDNTWCGIEPTVSFEEFVHRVAAWDLEACDRHCRRQTTLIPVSHVDFIGSIENIDEDVRTIAQRASLPLTELPRLNATPSRQPYQSYYTSELAALVGEMYEPDAAAFGYRFEPV